MRLQVVRAIYKRGVLIFAQPELTPRDGTEVVLTYVEEAERKEQPAADPIRALRGRGKGERLVEKLLQSRREDKQHDESSSTALRA
ncbi:MAG: hypothetical protein AB7P69_11605 [Candidatus Binatia bacterium]